MTVTDESNVTALEARATHPSYAGAVLVARSENSSSSKFKLLQVFPLSIYLFIYLSA